MKKLLILLILPIFLLAGCKANNDVVVDQTEVDQANVAIQEETSVNENVIAEEESDETPVVSDITESEIGMVWYENKAVGYQILRPDNWYWRHYIGSEIIATGGNENVDDYLIISPDELVGLGGEYLGPIVIEKSAISLSEFKSDLGNASSVMTKVGGHQAEKFEWSVGDYNFVAYILERDNFTLRFIYQSLQEDPELEAIFEDIVGSFEFTT